MATQLPGFNTIQAAQHGDLQALASLTTAIRPLVERQLNRYPVAEFDRQDLLQNTMIQVIRRLGSFRGEASFSTWLFRVTANEALMLMRSRRRQQARIADGVELNDLGVEFSTWNLEDFDLLGADEAERSADVRDALDELPESYRTVVMAHYNDDLGLQEIASRLNVTESAVRSRLHRARSQLRNMLSIHAPSPMVA